MKKLCTYLCILSLTLCAAVAGAEAFFLPQTADGAQAGADSMLMLEKADGSERVEGATYGAGPAGFVTVTVPGALDSVGLSPGDRLFSYITRDGAEGGDSSMVESGPAMRLMQDDLAALCAVRVEVLTLPTHGEAKQIALLGQTTVIPQGGLREGASYTLLCEREATHAVAEVFVVIAGGGIDNYVAGEASLIDMASAQPQDITLEGFTTGAAPITLRVTVQPLEDYLQANPAP